MNWRTFLGACILVGYMLLANGAPLFAVALGIGLAAAATAWRRRAHLVPAKRQVRPPR